MIFTTDGLFLTSNLDLDFNMKGFIVARDFIIRVLGFSFRIPNKTSKSLRELF